MLLMPKPDRARKSDGVKTAISNKTSSKEYICKTEALNKALGYAGVSKSAVTNKLKDLGLIDKTRDEDGYTLNEIAIRAQNLYFDN